METSAIVFLFESQAEGVSDWYGGDFDSAFLRALSVADKKCRTHSAVLRGDAIVDRIATKITAASSDGKGASHTQSVDMELYRTLIWDLADSLSTQWQTIDEDAFPLILGARGLHCIAVPTLPTDLKEEIDRQLRGTKGYVGALQIDLGNPIQRAVFVEFLIKDAVIHSGKVLLDLSWDGSPDTVFEGAEEFLPGGLCRVKNGQLENLKPKFHVPKEHSPRGLISLARYEGKRKFGLQERVLAALAYRGALNHEQLTYDISVNNDPDNTLEANLPETKFIRYLLDINHPAGGPKAKFFLETLGISNKDWRHLAAQLHDGLGKAELVEVFPKNWQGGFGISFNAVIPVVGLNGQTASIDTNWIMEPGQLPRLSTAVPASKTSIDELVASPVVPSNIRGYARWKAVFDLASQAGQAAALAEIPTPMFVNGFGIEMEGQCGFAWVKLPDARSGFARWAISNKLADHHYRSGAQIFSDVSSQSIGRRRAYATAFAIVLQHNGINCRVESRLD